MTTSEEATTSIAPIAAAKVPRTQRNGKSSGKGKKLMEDKSSMLSLLDDIPKANNSGPSKPPRTRTAKDTPAAAATKGDKPKKTLGKYVAKRKEQEKALRDTKAAILEKSRARKRARKADSTGGNSATASESNDSRSTTTGQKNVGFAV